MATAYVVNQPAPLPLSNAWSSGLCDCFDDMGVCCLTCWCPCVTYGDNVEKVSDGQSSCCIWGTLYCLAMGMAYFCVPLNCCLQCGPRGDIRRAYGLVEDPNDCLVSCCCSYCALCQEARQLQKPKPQMATVVPGVIVGGVYAAPMQQQMTAYNQPVYPQQGVQYPQQTMQYPQQTVQYAQQPVQYAQQPMQYGQAAPPQGQGQFIPPQQYGQPLPQQPTQQQYGQPQSQQPDNTATYAPPPAYATAPTQ